MTVFCAVRSIPMSEETKQAWRGAGAIFMRRARDEEEVLQYARDESTRVETGTFILNLGNSEFNPTDERIMDYGLMPYDVWNRGENVRTLLYPGAVRELFSEYAVPRPVEYPANVWIKTPGGRKGRGNFRKGVEHELVLPPEWDWQADVLGQEYRVITVGKRIVQNFRRTGGPYDREYHWTPMEETPAEVKTAVRKTARKLDGFNVVAWDAIQTDDGAYIFEGNTCPGMSDNTASRIVREIERQREENDN